MTDDQLEALLQQHRPAPAPALKSRIVKEARSRSQWAFYETMAALLLLGMNLSLIAASVTHSVPPRPPASATRVQNLAAAIARLELPLPQNATQALAAQLAAGENLVLVPHVPSPAHAINLNSGGNP